MTTYPTDIHTPFADAPFVTNKVAKCNVCDFEWQVRSPNGDDTRGCSFCDAPANAISVSSEKPTFGGARVR